VSFRKVADLGIDTLPENALEGVAVSPDHRWYVVSSFRPGSVTVYDAESLKMVSQVGLPWAHGVGILSDGSLAVVGARLYTLGLRIPDLEQVFLSPFSSNYPLAAPDGDGAYLGSWGALARIDRTGRIEARPEGRYAGYAISEDGSVLLAGEGSSAPRLVVFDLPGLHPVRDVPLPFLATLVIPLADPKEALVIGGGLWRPTGVMPTTAAVVNHVTGEIEPVQQVGGVLEYQTDGYRPYPGEGNPWAEVEDSVVLIPSLHGLLVVDRRTGRIGEPLSGGESFDLPFVPCCEIAYDRLRKRVLMASRIEGRLLVFEVTVTP
jgi:hypothetical protein